VKYEAALKSDKFLLLAHGTADEVAKARGHPADDARNGGCSAMRLNAGNLPGAADSLLTLKKWNL